jgi:hypothetical protein
MEEQDTGDTPARKLPLGSSRSREWSPGTYFFIVGADETKISRVVAIPAVPNGQFSVPFFLLEMEINCKAWG